MRLFSVLGCVVLRADPLGPCWVIRAGRRAAGLDLLGLLPIQAAAILDGGVGSAAVV